MAAIFIALLMVAMLIFTAFAVDLGAEYAARRNDQNAADTGSLGGVMLLSGSNANVVSRVKDLVFKTTGDTISDAAWNSCTGITDPDLVDTPMTGANCITTNGPRTQLQVRVPVRSQTAFFGKAAGVVGFDHSAFAIAGLVSVGFGSVLPFGMPASAGNGDGYACLKSGSSGTTVDPCQATTGNFGYVDFSHFGNTEINTPLDCGNGGQRPRAANNMAVGVDHDLSTLAGEPWLGVAKVDTAACGTTPQTQSPNAMATLTGNTVSQALNPGIAFGTGFSDGGPGRLARTIPLLFSGAGVTRNVSGVQLDDNPLWEFIPTSFPAGASVPSSCQKSVFTTVLGGSLSGLPSNVQTLLTPKGTPERMRLLLQRCITHYRGTAWTANGSISGAGDPSSCPSSGCTDPVFSRNSSSSDSPDLPDIQYTSRFGYVPQLTTDFPNGNATVYISSFRAIFLQRLLGSCNGNSCGLDFEPGLGINKAGSPQDAEAVTAFAFPSGMLPNGLASSDAPFKVGVNRFVRLVR
jgi:hypothetical protein